MKVLFTLNPFTSAGGGSVSFARTLADALIQAGVEVCFDPGEGCDAVLVFAHCGTPGLLARHKRRGARILHRLDERIDPGEDWRRRRKHRWIRQLNRFADLTVFQSEFVRGNVGPVCRARTWRVIRNGVDPAVFTPDGPVTRLEGEPAVLHVSWSIGASKRLDRIGELLAGGPPGLRVYCVGHHAASGQAWLRDPRVAVLGARPRDEVAALMRGADVLFFPSELEPCPNTPLEAMACGLPALYHASGGTTELLGDAGLPIGRSLGADLGRLVAERGPFRGRALARAPEFHAARVAGRYREAFAAALDAPAAPSPSPLFRLWHLVGHMIGRGRA